MNAFARLGVAILGGWMLLACGGAPRGECNPEPEPGSLGSICGFENPEDLAHAGSAALLLVSEMRAGETGGALAALGLDADGAPDGEPRRLWPPADPSTAVAPDGRGEVGCTSPPAAQLFEPHGIDVGVAEDDIVPVAVVNHAERESIELFDLEGAGAEARLTWRGCVTLPAGARGNDVALGRDGAFAATNYEPDVGRLQRSWNTVRGGMGFPTGDIRIWEPGGGWRTLPDSVAANPNGVAWAPDATHLFFTETGTGTVRRVGAGAEEPPAAEGAEPAPSEDPRQESIEIGGHPDALSWSQLGSLLAVTHLAGFEVLQCRWWRRPCGSPWAVIAIEPDLSSAVELFRHDGADLGAASSAVHVGTRFYLGAVFDDRIGVFELPR